MKKKHIAACLLSVAALFCLCPGAAATPAADLSMQIADWEQVGDAVEFNVVIDIGTPSEPYASLDFSIVSSNEERLHIVDLSEIRDKSKLAFDFSPDYGGVYHKGRIDEADGSVSYLVGLFSQTSGNNIMDETNICSVKLRYSGDLEQELSLENLKLVYKNPDGEITGVTSEAKVSQNISQSSFVQIPDETSPLSDEPAALSDSPVSLPEDGASPSVFVYILTAAAVLIVALIAFRKRQRSKRKSAHSN